MTQLLGRIRAAVDSDIAVIEAWLKRQRQSGVKTLEMNWNLTLKVYRNEGMLIYEDASSQEAIAYFWGSLSSTDSILEVRADQRGHGVGTAFVEYLLKQAHVDGEGLLCIDCGATESEDFWRKMKFDIEDVGHQVLGKRILSIPRALPVSAEPVEVVIRFYPESASYKSDGVPPLAEFRPSAVQDQQGIVWLAEKISCFDLDRGDLVVEAILDGTSLCRGKAKHEQARTLGFFSCCNGYAIEKITPPLP
ncbi:hypothetical protein O3301_16525 [Janthinobacterium sp. SUN211]|uniref:hypothetical protein n=1 Tax=Janthinobacterium sp. SUN211 TaxID=3014786 RepID=UPI0027124D37|nr:hypothetical protein [Janthinobacterium sp. SUN211]MDO8050077.1 hypothetical protein [Janthinobacterium sp. SUN211]